MFDELFSTVFCINLTKRKDRWKRVTEEFRREGIFIERIPAIDGDKIKNNLNGLLRDIDDEGDGRLTKWEYGCLLSHRRCWLRAMDLGVESFWVFEDDVELAQGYKDKVNNVLLDLPEPWEIVSTGYEMWVEEDEHVTGNIYRSMFGLEAHGYGMKTQVAKELLHEMDGRHGQVDVVMGRRHRLGMSYVIRPILSWQSKGWSDIKKEYRNGVEI